MDAQYKIVELYCVGAGVEQSDLNAAKWYELSAKQGNPEAQFCMGWLYSEGHGLHQVNTFVPRSKYGIIR